MWWPPNFLHLHVLNDTNACTKKSLHVEEFTYTWHRLLTFLGTFTFPFCLFLWVSVLQTLWQCMQIMKLKSPVKIYSKVLYVIITVSLSCVRIGNECVVDSWFKFDLSYSEDLQFYRYCTWSWPRLFMDTTLLFFWSSYLHARCNSNIQLWYSLPTPGKCKQEMLRIWLLECRWTSLW